MIRSEKWALGIIPLIALGIATNFFQDSKIKEDLSERVLAEIKDPNITASISGRDITLNGQIFQKEEVQKSINNISSIWGVRKVIDNTELLPPSKPFKWAIFSEGDTVRLVGEVPSPAIKESLFQKAKEFFTGKNIVDETTLARGNPEGFENTSVLAMQQLVLLEEGNISFEDKAVSVKGKAHTEEQKDTVIKTLQTLPSGMVLESVDITTPVPYAFQAFKTDGNITLQGFVPSEPAKNSLLDAAKQFFSKDKIIDELKIVEKAPENFMQFAMSGLKALSRLNEGSFKLEKGRAELEGKALYDKAVDAIRSEFESTLPNDFSLDLSKLEALAIGSNLDRESCQTTVNELLDGTTIHFDTNKAIISPYSAGILDHIIATLSRCPETKVEIDGYTDSTGQPEFNQTLSEQRANAVMEYLSNAGLEKERFTAVGKGESDPVATNTTAQGKALNRRIEFIVE